jgi:hypothetical protein
VKLSWLPPVDSAPFPSLDGQRITKVNRLIARFARKHHRRPLHATFYHSGSQQVVAVRLENGAYEDLTT